MSSALAVVPRKRESRAATVQRKAACENCADNERQEVGVPRWLQQRRAAADAADEPRPLQAKLEVNRPGDALEHQADRVAAQVGDRPDAPRNGGAPANWTEGPPSASSDGAVLQRKCAACGGDDADGSALCAECAQRKAAGDTVPLVQRSVADAVDSPGPGHSIPEPVRGRIEPVLGRDLSGVQVHDDTRANDLAGAIDAKAFTHGDHIWLGHGQRADDIGLMAHEATHTVQQADASGAPRLIQREPAEHRHPEDGAAPRARMQQEIDEEVGEIEPVSEEETRESLDKIDPGEKAAKSAALEPGARPDVDRPAEEAPKVEQAQSVVAAEAETPGEPIVADQSEAEAAGEEAAETAEGEAEGEGEAEAEAEAEGEGLGAAEAAFAAAQAILPPMPEQPVEPPAPVMPVNADGEPMPGDPAAEAQVQLLGVQIETVRQGGFGLRIRAQQLMSNAALMRGNIELVSQHVGEAESGLVEAHTQLAFRQDVIAESENALSVSEQKAEQVATEAPSFQAEAEEAEGESGPMASEASETAAENEANMPDDAEAAESQAEQGQAMSSVASDSGTMDEAVGATKERAIQLQEDAAQAQEKNAQTREQIDRATESAAQTEARLGKLDGQAASARGRIDGVKDQPAVMEARAQALDAEGQALIASSLEMEDMLHGAQDEYERDMARVPGSETLAAENAGGAEQAEEGAAEEPGVLRTSEGPYAGRHEVNLGAALPGWLTGQGELTEKQREKQRQEAEHAAARRQSQLAQIAEMTGDDFSQLDAGDKASLAIQFMGQNLWDKVSNIGWPDFTLSGLGSMLIGVFDPRGPLSGVLGGLSKVASGTLNLFDPEQWARDPLGNLLKSAADIATGITIILGSITALAGVVIAIMAALILVTFGFAAPMALPVITFCGNVLVTVGGWTISVGLLALYYQSLLFIKNLVDAMTAETAEQLVQESGQMTADVEQAGQVAMQMGVAKLGQVGGRATIAQLDDLAGAAAQQGLSGTAATSQVAKTFAAQEIKQSTVGQFTAPLDLARAGYKKLKGPRGAAAAPRAGAPEPAAPRAAGPEPVSPPAARPGVEAPPARPQPEAAAPRAEPQEPVAPKAEAPEPSRRPGERAPDTPADRKGSLAESGTVPNEELTPRQLRNEVDELSAHPEQFEGTPPHRQRRLGEHEWREQPDGSFCRFSPTRICVDTPELRTTELDNAKTKLAEADSKVAMSKANAEKAREAAKKASAIPDSERKAMEAEVQAAEQRATTAKAQATVEKRKATTLKNKGLTAEAEAAEKRAKAAEEQARAAEADAAEWRELLPSTLAKAAQDAQAAAVLAAKEAGEAAGSLGRLQKYSKQLDDIAREQAEIRARNVGRTMMETADHLRLNQLDRDAAFVRKQMVAEIEAATGMTPQIRETLRKSTPFKQGTGAAERERAFLDGIPDEQKGPGGTYIDYITGKARPPSELSPDHVVSVQEICSMEGFGRLSRADQIEILDMPENLRMLERSLNESKGGRSLPEWLGSEAKLAPNVTPAQRQALAQLEAEARAAILAEIARRRARMLGL